jgi:hypothetical protein
MHASRGTALAVALVLLAGLAALALAAAAAAVTALALTSHQQGAAIALEAAEAGIAHALQVATDHPGPAAAGPMPFGIGGATQARFETQTMELAGTGAMLTGFSVGATDSAFQSRHFLIVSNAQATRNVRVKLEQGFYVVEPRQ